MKGTIVSGSSVKGAGLQQNSEKDYNNWRSVKGVSVRSLCMAVVDRSPEYRKAWLSDERMQQEMDLEKEQDAREHDKH